MIRLHYGRRLPTFAPGICGKFRSLLLAAFFLFFSCQNHPQTQRLTIAITTNLNGALDDCQCSPVLVGGLTRISTIIERIQQRHNGVFIAGGGDFLASYSNLANNRLMFKLANQLPYQFLAIGDQEFVEGTEQLLQWITENGNHILLPANLQSESHTFGDMADSRTFEVDDLQVAVINLIAPEAFEVVQPEDISSGSITEPILRAEARLKAADLQLLVWHGNWDSARKLQEQFPWLDVIMISHNQYRGFQQIGQTALIETGVDGEYVGRLTVNLGKTEERFEYQFIPVTLDVPADSRLLVPVLALRDSLQALNNH